MMNKKLMLGIVALLVVFATVQGMKPVLADNMASSVIVSVDNGVGQVCWTGDSTGCTSDSTTLQLMNGATLTFTATGMDGYTFNAFNSVSPNSSTYATLNPFTVTISGNSQYIGADFQFVAFAD